MSGLKKKGGCQCGAVRFEVGVPEQTFGICHCGICRKINAGPFMAVHCDTDIAFNEERGLARYQSSDIAERGFCKDCGTSLFYRMTEPMDGFLGVSVEAFDDANGFELAQHIFVDDQPARYAFKDNCPRLTGVEAMGEA